MMSYGCPPTLRRRRRLDDPPLVSELERARFLRGEATLAFIIV